METKVNTGMFDRVVRAIDSLAPGLKFFPFPSGTRVIIALHLITTTHTHHPHRAVAGRGAEWGGGVVVV